MFIYYGIDRFFTYEIPSSRFLGLDNKSTCHSQLKGLVNIFRLFSEIIKLVVNIWSGDDWVRQNLFVYLGEVGSLPLTLTLNARGEDASESIRKSSC